MDAAGGPATGAVLGFAGPGTHATVGRRAHVDDGGGTGRAVATATLAVETDEAASSVAAAAKDAVATTKSDSASVSAAEPEHADRAAAQLDALDGGADEADAPVRVICPICSAQVPAGQTSCATCGQPLLAEPEPSVTGVAMLDRFIALPRGRQYAIVAGIVAGVLVAVVAIAYLGALAGF